MARTIVGPIVSRIFRTRRRSERGQVLVMAAGLLLPLLGMVGLALDVGSYADHRRHLQNAADSAALAGAQELPNSSAAITAAEDWGEKNGIDPSDMTVTITAQSSTNHNPKISVQISTPHEFVFIGALGVGTQDVSARAAAIKTNPGGARITPWAVTEAVWSGSTVGSLVTLKYDSTNVTTGNFGAIRIDGSGSALYQNAIVGGSDFAVCTKQAPGCGENSPVCNDYICPSEPGNKVGPTATGVDWDIAHTDSHCDTFAEAFTGPLANGRYDLVDACSPWIDGGYDSYRVILIPIVESLCNGSCNLTVTRLSMFFLEGYDNNKCQGNACEIKGRFVEADVRIDALPGVYDPNAAMAFVRLSE
jgi:Flp pilus assembly protein TadG